MELRMSCVNMNVSPCAIIHLNVSSCLLLSRAFYLTKHRSPPGGEEVHLDQSPMYSYPLPYLKHTHQYRRPSFKTWLWTVMLPHCWEKIPHNVLEQCSKAIKLWHLPHSCNHRQTGKIFSFLTSEEIV